MMYLKLMKVFFKENLAFKRILGTDLKSSKIKTILIILAIIYGFCAVLLGFGFMFFELGKTLVQMDYLDLLLDFVFIMRLSYRYSLFCLELMAICSITRIMTYWHHCQSRTKL
ncbi:MAG TPA: hypothetical protein PK160_02640 [Bacillota bacterium]|nr:hypothetical protein [Bacillota bacterium]